MAKKKTTRRRRRTSSARGLVNVTLLKSAGVGAAGFLGADIALEKLPLPVSFRASPASQALTTIGLGLLFDVVGRRFLGNATATGLAGGMVLNGIVRFSQSTVPGLSGLNGCGCDGMNGLAGLAGGSLGGHLAAMSDSEFGSAMQGMLAAASNPYAAEAADLIDADVNRVM